MNGTYTASTGTRHLWFIVQYLLGWQEKGREDKISICVLYFAINWKVKVQRLREDTEPCGNLVAFPQL